MRHNKHYFPRKLKPTLDDLAYRYLEGRYPLRRMHQDFGRRATNRTITAMANILLMCDPEHQKSQEWMKRVNEQKEKYCDRRRKSRKRKAR